jgi:hypothetical protein
VGCPQNGQQVLFVLGIQTPASAEKTQGEH